MEINSYVKFLESPLVQSEIFGLGNYFRHIQLHDPIVSVVFIKFIKNVRTEKTVLQLFINYLQDIMCYK